MSQRAQAYGRDAERAQSAKSHHWPPDPDSGHPREAVCSQAMCQMGCIDTAVRRLLLSLSCYSGLRVASASASKQ